jgi:isopentenyldiphosphate isomerase
LDDVEKRTVAIDDMLHDLSDRGILPPEPDYSEFGGTDWFAVHSPTTPERLFRIRRFYSLFLGVHIESVILNGYDEKGYWLSERSDQVHFHKSMLDCLTAGCICAGETPENAVLEEGMTECGLRPGDLPLITFVKKMHFYELSGKGHLRNETFHIYDFKITNDFKPRVVMPQETAGFKHVSFDELYRLVEADQTVRPIIRVIAIDFLKRHGYIQSDHPDYQLLENILAQSHDFYA